MNKLTLLIGPHGSGKTITAKKIVERKKALFLRANLKKPLCLPGLQSDTEVIIFDEANLDFVSVIKSVDSLEFTALKAKMNMPDVIIISNCITKEQATLVKRNACLGSIEIIECSHQLCSEAKRI